MTQTQENDKKNGWTDGRTDRQRRTRVISLDAVRLTSSVQQSEIETSEIEN